MLCKVAPVLLLALQISSTGIALNNVTNGSVSEPHNAPSVFVGSHRVIKRFAPRFKFPKPQLPIFPRPTFPFPVFAQEHPKGDDGYEPKSKRRRRPRPTKPSPTKPSTTKPSPPSESHEDRTLLAAKKALLLKKAIIAKKAIILAKIKKKAILKKKKKAILLKKKKKFKKKAVLAYGLKKASKLKGFTLKAPNIHLSFGGPKPFKKGKKPKDKDEEEVEFLGGNTGENSSGENSESDDDDDDDDEDDDDELDGDGDDDDDEEDPKPETNSQNSNQQQEPTAMVQQPQTLTAQQIQQQQQQQALMMQQQAQTLMAQQQQQVSTMQQQPQTLTVQQQQHASMMQQLQQQLQQKQQEQLNQNQPQALQAQPQQQPLMAVVITPSPMITTTEVYTSAKKKAKKAKKKAKKKLKKATPRPVNLGVKANLLKKFDKLTKKATNQFSSFIQIDIDFFRSGQTGRAAIDDLIEPGRFVSRSSEILKNSYESTEEYEYVSDVEVPGNFIPSWQVPNWRSEYPPREELNGKTICREEGKGSCERELKPVYILFKQERL